MLTIRPAQSDDASPIAQVGYAAWLKGIGTHLDPDVRGRVSRDTFLAFAKACREQILVAEVDGTLAGFCATEDGDNDISDLWVSPSYEGRGVGSRLMSAVEEVIAKRGHERAEIEALTANVRAVSLYEHLGYHIIWQGVSMSDLLKVELHKTLLAKRLGGR
ncbi:MAG: GNAT family N-acetyltransferase [Pseudomonadota bacterium]